MTDVRQSIRADTIILDDIVEGAFGTDQRKQQNAYDSMGLGFYHKLAERIGVRLSQSTSRLLVIGGLEHATCAFTALG